MYVCGWGVSYRFILVMMFKFDWKNNFFSEGLNVNLDKNVDGEEEIFYCFVCMILLFGNMILILVMYWWWV